jgi:hypothetical protein
LERFKKMSFQDIMVLTIDTRNSVILKRTDCRKKRLIVFF